jgi:hypothetical protein
VAVWPLALAFAALAPAAVRLLEGSLERRVDRSTRALLTKLTKLAKVEEGGPEVKGNEEAGNGAPRP